MTNINDPSVLAFRLDRIKKGPRNWTFWLAAFTAVNGVFLAYQSDTMMLAGFVVPYILADGAIPHFIFAMALAVIGFFGNKNGQLFMAVFFAYFLDALFSAYLQLWAGVAMHLVVLFFVGASYAGAKQLATQLASIEKDVA